MTTIHQILTKYWGYTSFRPLQEDIINSVLDGKDTLALLPTGGGKSVCFQVPAMAKEGVCIVISPLIALMKDQVENLRKKNIPATAIFSGMSKGEIDVALDNCIYGNIKFLYLSPERLSTDLVQARLEKMSRRVNLLAIDEAHCISQWGYDFRPPYLKIAEIREKIPHAPVLALTATATPEVRKDIMEKLKFEKENIFHKSFERKNLSYVVFYEEGKLARMLNVFKKVEGTGIVYVRSRKKTKEISDFLIKNNIKADYYHAGLDSASRNKKQDQWIKEQIRVMVSTNAFGMGIDKSNVRAVVHMDLPDSLEAYYQEAGRAGRDEKRAYAVLLYNESDEIEFERRIKTMFPTMDEVRRTYQALANFYRLAVGSGEGMSYDFDINSFCNTYDLRPLTVFNSLYLLELEGYLATTDSVFLPSRLHFQVNNEELYRFQVANGKYDHLIKVILRSYGGTFDGYTRIQEKELAVRASFDEDQVEKMLRHLDMQGILSYLPKKDSPQIIFTRPRLDIEEVRISRQNLIERKKRIISKMESVLEYASKITKCRSQMLLAYLGETESFRCGSCDVCLERNKLELSDLEFNTVKDQAKQLLSSGPLTIDEVVENIKNTNSDKALKVIQWLVDNEKMKFTDDNRLQWHE